MPAMEAESAGRRPRLWLQFLIGVVAVGALAALVVLVPTCIVKRATRSASSCLDRVEKTGEDPDTCAPRWLAIARLAPHTRAEAESDTKSVASWIAFRHRLRVEKPNATAAMRAGAIAAIRRSSREPHERASDLMQIGAFEEAAAIDIGTAWIDEHAPLSSALTLGNIARAKQIVKQGVPVDARVGVVACLLGDKPRGLEILGHAARNARLQRETSRARVAGLLCGATKESFAGEDPFVDNDDDSYESAMFVRAYDPAFQAGRRRTLAAWLRDRSHDSVIDVGANALGIAEGEPTPTELYRWLMSYRASELTDGAVVAASPWMVRGRWYVDDEENVDNDGFVPPRWFQTAAARITDALAKPPPTIVEERDFDSVEVKDPHRPLRAALERLHAFTALHALRGGKREIAREALGKLKEVEPASLDLAVLQGALGEHEEALQTLDRWQADNKEWLAKEPHDTLPLRRIAHVNRVLAMLALGDLAGAHAAAVAGDLRDPASAWLAIATTILTKKPLASLSLPSYDNTFHPQKWVDALEGGTELPTFHDEEAERAWPAVFIVVGHAAILAGGDAERFLDARMPDEHRLSRTMMRARAEAARWRGDAASAKKWDERASAIEALIVDDRTAALAGIAGMW